MGYNYSKYNGIIRANNNRLIKSIIENDRFVVEEVKVKVNKVIKKNKVSRFISSECKRNVHYKCSSKKCTCKCEHKLIG